MGFVAKRMRIIYEDLLYFMKRWIYRMEKMCYNIYKDHDKEGDEVIQAVIFDLEGVLVCTEKSHFRAWKQMAMEQGLPFDEEIYRKIRGNGRMDALDIILKTAHRNYSPAEKFALTARKNDLYMEEIAHLTAEDMLPGTRDTIYKLRAMNVKVGVVSSSQNCVAILKKLGIYRLMDAVIDGSDVAHPEPDPEGCLLCAKKLGVEPEECLVIEDTINGITAAVNAGMYTLAVGEAAEEKGVGMRAKSLERFDVAGLIACRTSESK